MRDYPQELRDRVLAACDAGQPSKQVAERYDVSRSWVRRLKQRRRETGETAPRPRGGRRPPMFDRPRLAELVREQPDATLAELRERLGVVVSLTAICRALRQAGITLKKS